MYRNLNIVIIGLGYVGLPTAMAFSEKYQTLGIDINPKKIADLKKGIDNTGQFSKEEMAGNNKLFFSTELKKQEKKTAYLITVPTPVDKNKEPDLSFLMAASKAVGMVLKKEDIVIYESTTYPGCTEEECIPILEETSGLMINKDFGVGYSPERLSPGGNKKLSEIIRITAGSDTSTADFVDVLYQSIMKVPTHSVSSIKVAEAAKLLENCQRDVNISFINECALIFDKMGISTKEVLEAAGSKWNFLPFKPGLVGGHCISVDPYYFIYKAKQLGHEPSLIGAGRKINENMADFVVYKCLKLMAQKEIAPKGRKTLILGVTYKENCSDLRNSKVFDIYQELKEIGMEVSVADPLANAEEVEKLHDIKLATDYKNLAYDLIILTVPHNDFLILDWTSLKKNGGVLFDVKGALGDFVDGSL